MVNHKQRIYVVYYLTDMPCKYYDMGFVSKSRAENYKEQKEREEKNTLESFKRSYHLDTVTVDTNYMEGETPEFVY